VFVGCVKKWIKRVKKYKKKKKTQTQRFFLKLHQTFRGTNFNQKGQINIKQGKKKK